MKSKSEKIITLINVRVERFQTTCTKTNFLDIAKNLGEALAIAEELHSSLIKMKSSPAAIAKLEEAIISGKKAKYRLLILNDTIFRLHPPVSPISSDFAEFRVDQLREHKNELIAVNPRSFTVKLYSDLICEVARYII